VGFGEDGIEIQELGLSFLSKGKGKALPQDFQGTQADVGGHAGYLCHGGHWDNSIFSPLSRSDTVTSQSSLYSLRSEEIVEKIRETQGIYGWCCKGLDDWRVFWVGDASSLKA
jgi:hypothetical protein